MSLVYHRFLSKKAFQKSERAIQAHLIHLWEEFFLFFLWSSYLVEVKSMETTSCHFDAIDVKEGFKAVKNVHKRPPRLNRTA